MPRHSVPQIKGDEYSPKNNTHKDCPYLAYFRTTGRSHSGQHSPAQYHHPASYRYGRFPKAKFLPISALVDQNNMRPPSRSAYPANYNRKGTITKSNKVLSYSYDYSLLLFFHQKPKRRSTATRVTVSP